MSILSPLMGVPQLSTDWTQKKIRLVFIYFGWVLSFSGIWQPCLYSLYINVCYMTIPGSAVKLKREDDGVGVADLTYKAPLGAKVTVVHVLGPKLNQRLQVRFVVPVCYLCAKNIRLII